MSLIEPLLSKKEVEDQKLEKYSNDPLANLEKSIEMLSDEVVYDSFELDGTSDIEFRDNDSIEEKKFFGDEFKTRDIKCAATFAHKLAIGRIDGIIKIYDLDTKKEEKILKRHSNAINCLQVAIKQDFLISGSRDKTIIIWNLENYAQERVFNADSEVFCLEVTSGYTLFSGSLCENLIKKWNFWDENEFSTLSGHEGGITCIKSSKNNQFLISGSMDWSLRIWSTEDNQELKVLKCGQVISQILISEDDKYIGAETVHRVFDIWDLNKRELVKPDEYNFNDVIFLGVSSANRWIFQERPKGKIAIYNINDENFTFGINNSSITAIAYSNKNNVMFYGQDNNTTRIMDADDCNILAELKNFDCKTYKMLLIGNNDEYLASIMENGKIKIHEIYKNSIQEDFAWSYKIKENGVKLTRDGKYLILYNSISLKIWSFFGKKYVFSYDNISLLDLQISYDDKYFIFNDKKYNFIYVYSFQDMKEIANFDVETGNEYFCFTTSKDGNFIITGKFNGEIVVFDIENKSKICSLEGANRCILLLQINKTNEYLISVDKGWNLIFWSFLEKKIIKSLHFDEKIFHLKINDSHNCVVVDLNNWIEIWDFQKQIKIINISHDNYRQVATEISEDESYFIFPQNLRPTIWSFEYMKEVDSAIYNFTIYSLDITRDNKYIAITGGGEGCAQLWSCEEKRFIAKINFDSSDIYSVKFAADGKSIIVYDHVQARIYNIEKYVDYNRTDSSLYFTSGIDDKIIRKKYSNWIKNPLKYQFEKAFLDLIVYPIGYNALHYFCIKDNADLLSIALNDGGEIFRDKQNMSPLSYAIIRNSRRCIDKILSYVINLEDDEKLYFCIHQMRDDVPFLFNSKSTSLIPFLETLFRRRADKDHVGFYEMTEKMPISIFSPVSKIYVSAFTGEDEKKELNNQNEKLLQFWGSFWGYNYAAGSEESLFLLKKIDESENPDIFKTLLLQSVIRKKWEYLWPAIITISIVYWLNLITMILYIFDPSVYILSSFAALNGILAIYEFLQFSTKPIDYISEIWNLVDFIRMALSIIWAILEFYDENTEILSFQVVFFNFLKGLTYFRAFDFTRFYIRLILMALSDSFAFLIIFLYSTLAFGVLYASLDINLSFSDMWVMAYELNMGNFDNKGFSFLQYSCFTLATLINVVMMLNLLVSTLGDTFDRFQMINKELDTKEMLQFVLEFESIMFWARSEQVKIRNKGKLLYIQSCDNFRDDEVSDKWEGKITLLSLKIDAVKDGVLGNQNTVSEELKKLEENMEEKIIKSLEKTINGKVEDVESRINGKIEGLESKINFMIEMIKAKQNT